MTKNREKNKSRKGCLFFVLVVLVLLGLWLGGMIPGLGKGWDFVKGAVGNTAGTSQTEITTSQVVEQEEELVQLVVTEDSINFQGKEVQLEDLRTELEKLRDQAKTKGQKLTIELKDNKAIKATYDQVESLLRQLEIDY